MPDVLGDSLIGKTAGSGPVVLGSSPGPPAYITHQNDGTLPSFFVAWGAGLQQLKSPFKNFSSLPSLPISLGFVTV